jgi:predicted PhzF superfamily epimerase YddE/YHI9
MALPIYVVDAFTDQAFKGNPAAVCLTSEPTLFQGVFSQH